MGEWNAPFFGAQSQQQHTDLAHLRIASDPILSDAQNAAHRAALDAALPAETRAALERTRAQQAALDVIGEAQQQARRPGGSLDTLRAQITQTLGPEAAQRAVRDSTARSTRRRARQLRIDVMRQLQQLGSVDPA